MSDMNEMKSIVNQNVLEQRFVYHHDFTKASPFRHIVIEDFLEPAFCASLLNQFPDFDDKSAINENNQIGHKSTQERVRSLGSAYCRFDDVIQSPEFLQLIKDITGIAELKYDPHYFGGGTHENRQGQDLDPHIDFNYHPFTDQHRRLNLIIYLNEHWEDTWGGSLQLHRDPYRHPDEDDTITVTPLLNRCVIFETNEYSWHGFERIQLPPDLQHLSRKSFALYFYTDTRPADETVDEHSTVYVDRHLPRHIAQGRTLSAEDIHKIRLLLVRRDHHLQRLYKLVHRLYGERNRLKSNATPKPAAQLDPDLQHDADGEQVQIQMQMLQERIVELEQSTSWRVTAPLRAIRRLLAGGA